MEQVIYLWDWWRDVRHGFAFYRICRKFRANGLTQSMTVTLGPAEDAD
jgi:hypothetical protein